MAVYPGAIFSPVAKVNGNLLPAVDYNNPMSEIVAIETILGLNPQGAYATVSDRIAAGSSTDANALTGTTLAANVVNSSLTSVGTLAALTVTATIVGSVSGNAGSASVLQTPRNINGVAFNGSADITVPAAAGTLTGATLAAGVTASSLTSVGTLAALTVTATIVGSVSGSSASCSGNAGSATVLQTARNINGVSFNGSADITVPAAAGTLTGATLAANVVTTSITRVGTLDQLQSGGTLMDVDNIAGVAWVGRMSDGGAAVEIEGIGGNWAANKTFTFGVNSVGDVILNVNTGAGLTERQVWKQNYLSYMGNSATRMFYGHSSQYSATSLVEYGLSQAGSNIEVIFGNTSAAANSGINFNIFVQSGAAGDPMLSMGVGGVAGSWYLGIDNSVTSPNTDPFVIGFSTTIAPGAFDILTLEKGGGMAIRDGITAPATVTGLAWIYVDTADGDLKIKFGDGTVKTIVVDT